VLSAPSALTGSRRQSEQIKADARLIYLINGEMLDGPMSFAESDERSIKLLMR
jgi:hypothetical protein